jgi:hypothetical protein
METTEDGQMGNTGSGLDERLRQCISHRRALLIAIVLTSRFSRCVRVVDV